MARRKAHFQHPVYANDNALELAIDALTDRCQHMARAVKRTGMPTLRSADPTFAGLCKVIVSQQLSIASAAAIWARVELGLRPLEPGTLLTADAKTLAGLGLSAPKIKTLHALARAVNERALDLDALQQADDTTVVESLTAIHGIGPWTATIYLLFALRRQDAFPAGDLALQIATQRLMHLKERPDQKRLIAIAERWRPYRGAAAHILWADYKSQATRTNKTSTRSAKSQKKR